MIGALLKSSRRIRVAAWALLWIVVLMMFAELLIVKGSLFAYRPLLPYVLRDYEDDWTLNGFILDKLKRKGPTIPESHVVFMGGSAARESVTSQEAMARKLKRHSGRQIDFTLLCSMQQNFFDAAKLAASGELVGKTLLIAITPVRFSHGIGHGAHGIDFLGKDFYYLNSNEKLDDIFYEHNKRPRYLHRWRLYRTALHVGQVLKRHLKYMAKHGGKPRYVQYKWHRYLKKKPPKEKAFKRLRREIRGKLNKYQKTKNLSAALLKAAIDMAHQNGNRVILLDMPTNPIADKVFKKKEASYNKLIAGIVAEKNVGYIDLRKGAEWENKHFIDVLHMHRPGRRIFTDLLSKTLAKYLSSDKKEDGR